MLQKKKNNELQIIKAGTSIPLCLSKISPPFHFYSPIVLYLYIYTSTKALLYNLPILRLIPSQPPYTTEKPTQFLNSYHQKSSYSSLVSVSDKRSPNQYHWTLLEAFCLKIYSDLFVRRIYKQNTFERCFLSFFFII